MPAGASPKRERQYQHIKESYEKRGQKGRAEEIAARTVNKDRAEAGETKKSRSRSSARPQASSGKAARSGAGARGSSSPSGKPQARSERRGGGERTRAELYEQARRRGVPGRSRMSKAQLERAVGR